MPATKCVVMNTHCPMNKKFYMLYSRINEKMGKDREYLEIRRGKEHILYKNFI